MPLFGSKHQELQSQLDFIGRGIEMKSYDVARQDKICKPLAIRVSPLTSNVSSDPAVYVLQ